MNNTKYILIAFTCFVFFGSSFSQETYPSNTFVKTTYHGETFFANQNSAFIFYNNSSSELFVVVDFKKFKTGVDSLDEWLDDLDDTKLIFTGNFDADKLPALSNNGYKIVPVNGKILFNDIKHNFTIELVLFKILPESMLYRNTGNDYFDKLRANFQITIKPKEFKINKKPHHLKKSITINIGNGIINQFKPGMEHFIGQ